jgi:hypothetical protein
MDRTFCLQVPLFRAAPAFQFCLESGDYFETETDEVEDFSKAANDLPRDATREDSNRVETLFSRQ